MSDADRPRYPDYPGEIGPSGGQDVIGSWPHYEPGAMLEPAAPVPPPPVREPPAAAATARVAGWWRRVAARVVDTVLALALGMPLLVVGAVRWLGDVEWPDGADEPTGFDPDGYALVLAGLAVLLLVQLVLEVALPAWRGWTVGKLLLRLRLVDDQGAAISWRRALGRWCAAVAILFVPLAPLVDVLWPLWDPQKQTLHDQMAHTLVVRA